MQPPVARVVKGLGGPAVRARVAVGEAARAVGRGAKTFCLATLHGLKVSAIVALFCAPFLVLLAAAGNNHPTRSYDHSYDHSDELDRMLKEFAAQQRTIAESRVLLESLSHPAPAAAKYLPANH